MKKMIMKYLVLASVLALVFSFAADAHRVPWKRLHNRALVGQQIRGLQAAVEVLELTPDQVEEVRGIKENARQQAQVKLEAIKVNRTLLKEELEKSEPDSETIAELTITIYGLQNDVREIREQTHESLLNILNDKQKEHLDEIRDIALIMRAVPALGKLGFLAPAETPESEPELGEPEA
jgi:Spy/CpxP family protein refolding chaperone